MSPELTIIIVSCNTREDLLACLSSLASHPPTCRHETIVVDNASTDGSAAAVSAAFPEVRTIALERNVGFAAANNAGFRATTAPLVLLLNSDTLVRAGAIDTLIERLNAT